MCRSGARVDGLHRKRSAPHSICPLLEGGPRPTDGKLRADLLAMAKSEPQISMRAIVAMLQGPSSTDLDVLAETGIDVISEQLMQRTIVRGISPEQIIERARGGRASWDGLPRNATR